MNYYLFHFHIFFLVCVHILLVRHTQFYVCLFIRCSQFYCFLFQLFPFDVHIEMCMKCECHNIQRLTWRKWKKKMPEGWIPSQCIGVLPFTWPNIVIEVLISKINSFSHVCTIFQRKKIREITSIIAHFLSAMLIEWFYQLLL